MLLGTVEKIQPINLAIKNLHFGDEFFYYVIEPLLHELNLHNQAMMHFFVEIMHISDILICLSCMD